MKAESALILSAGYGTRMGELGKELPKPLWPVFEKSMLELHVLRLFKIGVKQVFINTHHHAEIIKEFVRSKFDDRVQCLYEPVILGSGGAIHNLYNSTNVRGNLLILNADVFMEMEDEELITLQQSLGDPDVKAALVAVDVSPSSKYNRLKLSAGNLVEIQKARASNSSITYSGVGCINLDKLEYKPGYSSLFDSVANYKRDLVHVHTPKKYEYWDFGTKEDYIRSHFNILRQPKSRFRKALEFFEAIEKEKIRDSSYGVDVPNSLSLPWILGRQKALVREDECAIELTN